MQDLSQYMIIVIGGLIIVAIVVIIVLEMIGVGWEIGDNTRGKTDSLLANGLGSLAEEERDVIGLSSMGLVIW